MPSIISHPAVPLTIGSALGNATISRRLLLAGVFCSIIPDLDVYLQLYTTALAHRGITHSIAFALVCGAIAAAVAPLLRVRAVVAWGFVTLATASHGLLDAVTNGGRGIEFFWPLSVERYFMPWRVIEVSPIGVGRFFSDRAFSVLASELQWVWLPALALGVALYAARRVFDRR